MEGAIFREHFRNAWIATVPGDGGSGLLAYDDDHRIVGACRSARALLSLTDGMIASGIDLSRYIKFDHHAARNADELVELRRADGSALGRGHVAPPLRATRPYADYIAWLRQQEPAHAEEFWRRELAGNAPPTLLAPERTAGAEVTDKTNIKGSVTTRTALQSGDIDIYWDYTGTGWITYLKQTKPIPDATITIQRNKGQDKQTLKYVYETVVETKTDDAGHFELKAIPEGTFQVIASEVIAAVLMTRIVGRN